MSEPRWTARGRPSDGRGRGVLPCFTAALAGTLALAGQQASAPQRVFASASRQFVEVDATLADLAVADVVIVGEQHGDPNTHRLELALIEGLARRRGDVVLSLEMFDRDVQGPIEHFLMGHLSD